MVKTQGVWIDNVACPFCGSKDNLSLYEKKGGIIDGFCQSLDCPDGQYKSTLKLSKTYLAEEYNIQTPNQKKRNNKGSRQVQRKQIKKRDNSKPITKEQVQKLFEESTIKGKKFRNVLDKYNKMLGIRTTFNEDGSVKYRYYPLTMGKTSSDKPKLVGYKKRICETKDFRPIGIMANECDLFNQGNCAGKGKYLLITAGEEDVVAAVQMLDQYRIRREDSVAPVDVVSSCIGEGAVHKQCQMQYDFIDSYDNIIVDMDNDERGQKALDELLKVLPIQKVKVMGKPKGCKDPSDALQNKLEKEWIWEFYNAKKPKIAGIVDVDDMWNAVIHSVSQPLIPLPKELKVLEDKLYGGLPYGEIINILAACVDSETEFFNGKGWKKISEYTEDDLVGQYNLDGTMSLVKPLEYIKHECEDMYELSTSRGLNQVLSSNHTFVYWQQHKRKDSSALKTILCEDLVKEHLHKESGFSRGAVKTVFEYEGEGLDITEGELRLQVAVMADGRIVKEGKNNYTQMRFNKKQKYERLIQICNKFNLKFKDNKLNNQGNYEVIVWPKWRDKYFNSKYYNCSKSQMLTILDEVLYWDSYKKNKAYCTTIKQSADFIQFAYAATGTRATISLDSRVDKYTNNYCASVSPTKNAFVGLTKGGEGLGAKITKVIPKDGYKYCFSVPSKYLVLRRNNKIFITGNSGVGKTTITNMLELFWIFNAPYKCGVISVEAGVGKFLTRLLSSYLGKNISHFKTEKEKLRFLENNKEECISLWKDENGDPRFILVDDKGDLDSLDSVKEIIEKMIRQAGCKIIIIDPIQDLLDSLSVEEQAAFVGWLKKIKARDEVTFINVNHTRKSGGGNKAGSQGGELTEEDMQGTSALYKSAAVNIILQRDKTAECEDERNTTKVTLFKSRDAGETGVAGYLFYDLQSAKLYNKDDWLEGQTEE